MFNAKINTGIVPAEWYKKDPTFYLFSSTVLSYCISLALISQASEKGKQVHDAGIQRYWPHPVGAFQQLWTTSYADFLLNAVQ